MGEVEEQRSTNSVVWIADERNNLLPGRCAVCGDSTSSAVRIWAVESKRVDWIIGAFGVVGVLVARAVGREASRIALPVTPRWWGIWQRRAQAAFGLVCFGVAGLVIALQTQSMGWVILGIVAIIAGFALRLRAFFRFWISAELRPDRDDIVIRRTDPQFDAAAKRVYTNRLNRRS